MVCIKITTAHIYIAPEYPQWGLTAHCAMHLQTQRKLETSGLNELYIIFPGAFRGDKSKQHAGMLCVLEYEVCGNNRLAMHMCTVCFYILAMKTEQPDVKRMETEMMIQSEWCKPLPNTLLSSQIPIVICPLLLLVHHPLHFPSSGNLFPPFEMSPTAMSYPSHLLQEERSYKCILKKKKICFSLVRKMQFLFQKYSLFIVA